MLHIDQGAISNIFSTRPAPPVAAKFLQTFAQALGYDVKEFAKLGLFADRPVDLAPGTAVHELPSAGLCQKDGSQPSRISPPASISVVKKRHLQGDPCLLS